MRKSDDIGRNPFFIALKQNCKEVSPLLSTPVQLFTCSLWVNCICACVSLQHFLQLYQEAACNQWVICVPHPGSLTEDVLPITRAFVGHPIDFIPSRTLGIWDTGMQGYGGTGIRG